MAHQLTTHPTQVFETNVFHGEHLTLHRIVADQSIPRVLGASALVAQRVDDAVGRVAA